MKSQQCSRMHVIKSQGLKRGWVLIIVTLKKHEKARGAWPETSRNIKFQGCLMIKETIKGASASFLKNNHMMLWTITYCSVKRKSSCFMENERWWWPWFREVMRIRAMILKSLMLRSCIRPCDVWVKCASYPIYMKLRNHDWELNYMQWRHHKNCETFDNNESRVVVPGSWYSWVTTAICNQYGHMDCGPRLPTESHECHRESWKLIAARDGITIAWDMKSHETLVMKSQGCFNSRVVHGSWNSAVKSASRRIRMIKNYGSQFSQIMVVQVPLYSWVASTLCIIRMTTWSFGVYRLVCMTSVSFSIFCFVSFVKYLLFALCSSLNNFSTRVLSCFSSSKAL